MAEMTVPMDDKALFQSAIEDVTEQPQEPEQPVQEEKLEEAQPEQPEQPQEPTPETEDKGGQVPSWRLREVREAREAAERRAEQEAQQRWALQQQVEAMQQRMESLQRQTGEPVDFFQNPDEAFNQRLTPLEARYAALESQVKLNSSRAVAIAMHGPQSVQEMETAVEKAIRENHPEMPLLAAQMRASDDPVNVAMQWHKGRKLWETTGGDPEAYRQKILDEAMKDPAYQAKVIEAARGPQAQSKIAIPPSLNKAPGSGSSKETLTQADMGDKALFEYATRK